MAPTPVGHGGCTASGMRLMGTADGAIRPRLTAVVDTPQTPRPAPRPAERAIPEPASPGPTRAMAPDPALVRQAAIANEEAKLPLIARKLEALSRLADKEADLDATPALLGQLRGLARDLDLAPRTKPGADVPPGSSLAEQRTELLARVRVLARQLGSGALPLTPREAGDLARSLGSLLARLGAVPQAEAPFQRALDVDSPAGPLLSDEGVNKEAFRVAGRDDLVLRVLREQTKGGHHGTRGPWHRTRLEEFAGEQTLLLRAKEVWNLPVIEPIERGTYESRPADVVPRYDLCLVARWWRGPWADQQKQELRALAPRLFGAPEHRARALLVLEAYRSAFDRGLVINDLQLLLAPGRIDLTDIIGLDQTTTWRGDTSHLRQRKLDQEALLADLFELVRSTTRG
jgi:hypothetical protein